jgi:sigma-B regulation protein RsbU (phosphoserine phosphatase)
VKKSVLSLLTLMLFVSAGARAQTPSEHAGRAAAVEPVRYHFGDNPDGNLGWANPAFDDSSWPVAQNGLVPSRSRDTNRFLWVRIRVPVPDNLNGPLALHLADLGVQPMTWQVFVNGQPIGGQGAFPPHADPADPPVSPVMDLPSSLAPPGSAALVAVREWHAPAFLESDVPSHPTAVIDEARVLSLTVRASGAEALVANGPEYALSAVLALAGIALLVFWRSSQGREYLWAAIMLLSPLATAILSSGLVTARLSFHAQTLAIAVVYSAGLIAEIEFMWTLFQLRSRWIRILWHAIWVAFILAEIAEAYFLQSPAFEHLCQIVIVAGIAAFDCILFPVCIREMFRPGGYRAIAAAQSLMEVIIALGVLGYSVHLTLGPFPLDLFQLTVTLLDMAIAAMLFRRAWKAWKESSSLRVEFEAAREVQQQLVTAPPTTPGFRIEAAYRPATHVGGDFFRILPEEDGGVLLVVGDVSGKGLKAAMTVSAIMGALHDYSTSKPAEVLAHLNRVLHGRVGGFVTCCAAFIAMDGTMILANAGNPAPYRNGEEMAVEPGLPLGMLADVDYAETNYRIAPGDRLTFVSDGVVEATNQQGELYGFERTQAISSQSANAIAEAVMQFGQEDDITVVTLTRESVEAAATTQQSVPSLTA